jgi:branched-chain amino acid transport system ATP-binding protein
VLELKNADVYYGSAQALYDFSLAARVGEVVALIGRNGAGKSTAMKAMAGWLKCRKGVLVVDGARIEHPTPEDVNRAGIALVPEDRQIFPTLTVAENLRMARVTHQPARWREREVYELFPRLGERQEASGAALSGGEQQMLAIGRALLCQPKVLLLDEPTEGLAPVVVNALIEAIRAIAAEGVAIVLVEQNVRIPELLAQRLYVLDSGRVGWKGNREEFIRHRDAVERLISI